MPPHFADVNVATQLADWIQVNRQINEGCVGLALGGGEFALVKLLLYQGAVNHFAHYFADVNGDGLADWVQVNRQINEGCVGLALGDGTFAHWSNCSSARGAVIITPTISPT